MEKDLYLILQVTRQATPEDIRSAYRRRALELHPDLSGTDSEGFIELQEAYSVLSDPTQKAAYDRSREFQDVRRTRAGRSTRRPAEPFREVEPAVGLREVSLAEDFESFAPSLDEIFDRWWSNYDLGTRPKAETLESLTVDVPLSPAEAHYGGTVRISVPARIPCPACRGHGSIGIYECWRCHGGGAVAAEYPLDVDFPALLQGDYIVRVPLDELGIRNFYLTIRFRPTDLG